MSAKSSEKYQSREAFALELLTNVAKARYRKSMEKFTSIPTFIDDQKLVQHHQKALFSALELVSETRPMTHQQKQHIKQTLDFMFKRFEKINEQRQKPHGPSIGIDLGTTFCCLAVYRNNGKTEIIPNDLGKNKTPSYIAFPQVIYDSDDDDGDDDSDRDNPRADEETSNEPLFGETAKDLAHENPQYTIFDVKRMLGRTFYDFQLQHDVNFWPFDLIDDQGQIIVKTGPSPSQTHSPLELTSLLIKHLKELAENYIGEPIISAVVALPAYFNSYQREMTKVACEIAGLNVLQLINEPTSAAIAYQLHSSSKNKNKDAIQIERKCLIFDFGGGTFDVAVLTMKSNQVQVLAVGGDSHLGGEDVDNNMVEYCIQQFKKEHGVDLKDGKKSEDPQIAMRTSRRLRRLKLECEKQKQFLSQIKTVVISLDAMHGDTGLVVKISRDVFDSINKDIFDKCFKVVEQVLSDCKMDRKNIDDVVLVGGSSRIPKIQEMLAEFFDERQLKRSINEDEAVAVGAAMLAMHAEHVEIPNVLIQESRSVNSSAISSTGYQMEKQLEAKSDASFVKVQWTRQMGGGPQKQAHAAVAMGSTIVSLGGNSYGSSSSQSKNVAIDIYVFYTAQSPMKWKLLRLPNEPNCIVPSHRYFHTAVASGHHIYLWGGLTRSDDSNTLYRFDTKNLKWEKPKVGGVIPSARWGHTAVIIRNKMYIFGGYNVNKEPVTSNLHTLDLETLTWSLLLTKSTSATPRAYHTATVYKNRFMLIFGGEENGSKCSSAIAYFDVENNAWLYSKTNGVIPYSRKWHCAFMDSGFMYVFGGWSGETNTRLNDLFRYNPVNMEWKEVTPTGEQPSPRYCSECVVLNNQVFVFGGYGQKHNKGFPDIPSSSKLVTLSDTFVLKVVGRARGILPPARAQNYATVLVLADEL